MEQRAVHPVAALFPMMTDDELDDLAADIKANGQLHPIVVDKDGTVIDGRNRLEGCRRAGREPTFTTLNGQDPVAFILSANVARRHLTKGQQAMAVARALLFFKNRSAAEAAQAVGVSRSRVAYAVTILDHAPDLADAVLAGDLPLNDAYEQARQAKLAAEGRSAEAARLQVQMERLRAEAPDLADLVQEGRLTLAAASTEITERKREAREYLRTLTRNWDQGLAFLDPYNADPEECAREGLKVCPEFAGSDCDFSAARVRRVCAMLLRYACLKEEQENESSQSLG